MKTSKQKNLFVVGIVLIALGCICMALGSLLSPLFGVLTLAVLSIPGSQPIAAPEAFPNTEIIYARGDGLGFVNADGSGRQTFPFRALGHSLLDGGKEIFFMTDDHQTLLTVYTGYGNYDGTVYAARPGQVAVNCGWNGMAQLAPDQQHILIGTEQGHEQYPLSDCGTGDPPEKVIGGAGGGLSPDEQYSVEAQYSSDQDYDTKYDLIVHDLSTGEARVIAEGNFPVWSRDGQWLAYTGADGIYVVQNGFREEPRRVVSVESAAVPFYEDGQYPPVVSWSPDGRWLVYHTYNEAGSYYSIFKVDVETGETIELLKDGMFPYWIGPAQEP